MPRGANARTSRIADVPGMDLAVDAQLAHAPRDQLGVLRAEVEDQDAVGVDVGMRVPLGRGAGVAATLAMTYDTR